MKKNTPAQSVEVQTLDLLVELFPVLAELGVYGITPGAEKHHVHFNHGVVARMASVPGVTVDVEATPDYIYAEFGYKGLRMGGCMSKDELPTIGYHMVDGKPVKIDKTA